MGMHITRLLLIFFSSLRNPSIGDTIWPEIYNYITKKRERPSRICTAVPQIVWSEKMAMFETMKDGPWLSDDDQCNTCQQFIVGKIKWNLIWLHMRSGWGSDKDIIQNVGSFFQNLVWISSPAPPSIISAWIKPMFKGPQLSSPPGRS